MEKMIDINLTSLFLTVQAVLPIMKKQSFGRIITMSSNTVWLGTLFISLCSS